MASWLKVRRDASGRGICACTHFYFYGVLVDWFGFYSAANIVHRYGILLDSGRDMSHRHKAKIVLYPVMLSFIPTYSLH